MYINAKEGKYMFSILLGEYLLAKDKITKDELAQVKEKVKSVRVKLGLIAVAEGMMTVAQTENVNRIQALEDKRFGDIAVEKNYLTEEQVGRLLKLQGNSYLQFVQALVDESIMSLEEVERLVDDYAKDNGLSELDIDMLKSGDTNKEILVLVNTGDIRVNNHLSMAVRNLIRFISSDVVVSKVEKLSSVKLPYFGYQMLDGDFKTVLGFGGEGDALITIANAFAKESYTEVDEDTYDAVCEFANCINGLYASDMSEKEVEIDMLPPQNKDDATINAKDLYVMTVKIDSLEIKVVIAIGDDIEIN